MPAVHTAVKALIKLRSKFGHDAWKRRHDGNTMVLVNVEHVAGAVPPQKVEANSVAALLEALATVPGFGRGVLHTTYATGNVLLAGDASLPQPSAPGGMITLTFMPIAGRAPEWLANVQRVAILLGVLGLAQLSNRLP